MWCEDNRFRNMFHIYPVIWICHVTSVALNLRYRKNTYSTNGLKKTFPPVKSTSSPHVAVCLNRLMNKVMLIFSLKSWDLGPRWSFFGQYCPDESLKVDIVSCSCFVVKTRASYHLAKISLRNDTSITVISVMLRMLHSIRAVTRNHHSYRLFSFKS